MACKSRSLFSKPRKLSVLLNYEKAVISAFKWDCESFLEQFEKKNSLHYADFAKMWQLKNITYIFADQTNESLHIKVGAFFLLYGLYYKQPIEGLVKIRLTLGEYRCIKQLMNEMVNRQQYDILYIFAKMKSDNVFLYTAEPEPINIELNKSVKSMSHLDDTFQSRHTESSLTKLQNILEDPTVQSLQKTCSEYDDMLKKYAGKNPGVLQFKSTIITDLKETHNKVFGEGLLESKTDNKSEGTSIMNTRQSIRLRAMLNQNAVYRGSKEVVTAVDLNHGRNYDSDEDFEKKPRKTARSKPRSKGRPPKKCKRSSKKSIGVKEGSGESD